MRLWALSLEQPPVVVGFPHTARKTVHGMSMTKLKSTSGMFVYLLGGAAGGGGGGGSVAGAAGGAAGGGGSARFTSTGPSLGAPVSALAFKTSAMGLLTNRMLLACALFDSLEDTEAAHAVSPSFVLRSMAMAFSLSVCTGGDMIANTSTRGSVAWLKQAMKERERHKQ